MIKQLIPLLHISHSQVSEAFYRDRLGFRILFANRPDPAAADPCYLGLERDGQVIHLSSFAGDGVAGGVINLLVEDVDQLHKEFVGQGVKIDLEPTDQTWGNREMYVKDPDRNSLRFIHLGRSK